MDINEVDVITQEALRRYYSILSKKGYYNYDGVYKILLLVLIRRLLNSDLSVFITRCDKKVIDELLNKLYCSICPIPTPHYTVDTEVSVFGESEYSH